MLGDFEKTFRPRTEAIHLYDARLDATPIGLDPQLCPLCVIISNVVVAKQSNSDDESWRDSDYSAWLVNLLSVQERKEAVDYPIETNVMALAVTFRVASGGDRRSQKRRLNFESNLRKVEGVIVPATMRSVPGTGSHFMAAVLDSRHVDFERIREWIVDCQENHSGHCSPASGHFFDDLPEALTVIDCKDGILATHSGEDYVALSYVWGTRKTARSRCYRKLEFPGRRLSTNDSRRNICHCKAWLQALVGGQVLYCTAQSHQYVALGCKA